MWHNTLDVLIISGTARPRTVHPRRLGQTTANYTGPRPGPGPVTHGSRAKTAFDILHRLFKETNQQECYMTEPTCAYNTENIYLLSGLLENKSSAPV